jgi:outer membrane protein assembly factor BamB
VIRLAFVLGALFALTVGARATQGTALAASGAVAAAAAANPAPQLAAATSASLSFTARELAQGYRDGVVLAEPIGGARPTLAVAESAEGMRVRRSFARFGGLRVLELPAGETPPAAIARLRATGRYRYVEPDYVRHVSTTPNDPDFIEQWALSNHGAEGGLAGADIHAVTAWSTRTAAVAAGGTPVIVAVIDSGILTTHQDLAANLWVNPNPNQPYAGLTDSLYGLNTVAGSGLPTDDLGHGTHVAGILGAVGNNGLGVCGVAWQVQLMALKFIDSAGNGGVANEITCIDYAIAKGAAVINASFGSNTFSQAELNAIRNAGAAGIVFVAAAGNSSFNNDDGAAYPADYPLDNLLAVGASDNRDTPATFSDFGSGLVELFAPGVSILSTYFSGPASYQLLSGTSMAAPLVSGTLALLRAQYPGATYRQLVNRVLNGVDPGAALAGRCSSGGRLDLANALNPATSVAPPNATFAARTVLTGFDPQARSNNADAAAVPEAGTPAIAGATGGHPLWWQWTAPENATVEIDTSGSGGGAAFTGGSSFNTLLGVYTGGSLGALTLVAGGGAYGVERTGPGGAAVSYSRVTFHTAAGTTYQLNVQGLNGATGQAILSINTTPDHDAIATPLALSGASVSWADANLNASRQPGEPQIQGGAGGHSLWYAWTAAQSGPVQVSAYSYQFVPAVAVYTGTAFSNLGLVASAASTGSSGTAAPASGCLAAFTAAAGVTYLMAVDGVSARDVGDFTLTIDAARWQAVTGDAVTGSPAVGSDGSVYVGSDDGTFYAFNPDGSLKWSHATSGSFDTSAATVGPDGTIYAGGSDGKVYAFNPDGSLKWTYTIPTPSDSTLSSAVAASPALAADGTLYVKAEEGHLYALTSAGALKWTFAATGVSYAAPTVAPDGTIYLGTDGGLFYALTPAGTAKWSAPFATPVSGDGIYTAAAIDAAGNVYFGTLGGNFYSLDPTGKLRWSYATGAGISSAPALGGTGAVYFGGYDSKVYALSAATGAVQWTYALGGQVRASAPAIDANGVIYLGSYDHNVYALNANGSLLRTYATGDWVRSSPAIDGTTLYVGSNDHKVYAFDLGVGAAGAPWPMYQAGSRRLGRLVAPALAITVPPLPQSVAIGASLTLSVAAAGTGPLADQWSRNGVAIPGAVNATYLVPVAAASDSGSYTVTVTGPQGSVTSAAVAVAVGPASPGRILNLSARAQVGGGGSVLIAGFVIGGSGSKTVLLRGAGPTLASLGVAGALSQPVLTLDNAAGTVLAADTGWLNAATPTATPAAALSAAFAQVGAFPFTAASGGDSALLTLRPAAAYTALVSGASGGTGVALAEIYDADAAANSAAAAGPKLTNISARAAVGTGSSVLIAGFIIGGNQPVRVLLRGIGPGLAQFGVTGFLTAPQLALFDLNGSVLQSNAGWGGTAALSAAFQQVGAFALPAAAGGTPSADGALLATLAPGSYTAQVSGVGGTTGLGLVEVYLLP